jgi:hypothetical protein
MKYTNTKREQTEEENMLIGDVSDDALETAADTARENAGNITWYYCPSGLTICRF